MHVLGRRPGDFPRGLGGCAGPNLLENSQGVTLRLTGRRGSMGNPREILLPGARQHRDQVAHQPQLGVGELHQLGLGLFMFGIWGKEVGQQEPLFGKAEEMFDIVALPIRQPDVVPR